MRRGVGIGFGGVVGILFLVWIGARVTGNAHLTSPMYWATVAGGTATKAEPPAPPPAFKAASVLEHGAEALTLVRYLGSPACQAPVSEGTRMVWSYREPPGEGCAPQTGDLVVNLGPDNTLSSIVPEWGTTQPVANAEAWLAFKRRYERAPPRPDDEAEDILAK